MPVTNPAYVAGGSHRNLFGSILHTLGIGLHDIESAAFNAIPGTYHMVGEAIHDPLKLTSDIVEQTYQDFRHPLRHPGFTALSALGLIPLLGTPARVARIAAIAGRSGALPAELATRELAVQAGRTAEYNRIIKPGTGTAEVPAVQRSVGSQIGREIFSGLPKEERLLRMPVPHIPGEEILGSQEGQISRGWHYSKDPIIRKAQKLVDEAYERFPEGTPPPVWRVLPPFWRTQAGRINSARKGENLINRMTSRTKALQFLAAFAARDPAEHMAVRMVGEMTTPESRLAFHQMMLDSGALPPRLAKETEQTMATIQEASKYLENKEVTLNDGTTHVVPKVRDEYTELQDFVNKAREISNDRSLASRLAGVLTGESHWRRINGPRNLILAGKIPDNLGSLAKQRTQALNLKQHKKVQEIDRKIQEEMGQLSFDEITPTEELIKGDYAEELARAAMQETGGGFRIPYRPERAPKISFGQDAYRRAYTGRKPRVPGTYTHQFTGAILKYGGGEANVAKLLAESYTEAHRFISLMHARNFILANAKDTPESIPEEFRQLVRTDEYFTGKEAATYEKAGQYAQRTPEQKLMDKGDALTPEDTVAGGKLYEGMRREIFPQIGELTRKVYHDLMGHDGKTYQAVPGYKWIDKRLLGGLDRQNPLYGAFESGITRRFIHTADIINNVQKAMILYLKPSYMLPNVLGNVALSMVQQGFLMPYNLARTFKMRRSLKPETMAQIKGSVGQGISASGLEASSSAHALAFRGGNYLADKYGKVVDDPFREASFFHEARESGFSTKEEIEALVNDPTYAEDFRSIASRANEELINYERLGPGEQAFLRRLVFFYPWVKGSSRYASQFAKEHPLAASFQGVSGQIGEERAHRYFGNVPSYELGMIPYDVSNPALPIVGGTQSTSVLGEPAELMMMISNLVKKNPNLDLPLSANLAPADAGLLALITAGKVTTLGHPGDQPAVASAFQETFGGQPLLTLWRQLHGKSATGGEIERSLFPDRDRLNPWFRFFATGALTPRPYNRMLGEIKAYRQEHPGWVD